MRAWVAGSSGEAEGTRGTRIRSSADAPLPDDACAGDAAGSAPPPDERVSTFTATSTAGISDGVQAAAAQTLCAQHGGRCFVRIE